MTKLAYKYRLILRLVLMLCFDIVVLGALVAAIEIHPALILMMIVGWLPLLAGLVVVENAVLRTKRAHAMRTASTSMLAR